MLKSIHNLAIATAIAFSAVMFQPMPEPAQPKTTPTEIKEAPLTQEDKRQIQCLADNIYYEARNQPKVGKIAVSNVVINRVEDPRFPKDPCSVIKQKRGKTCQFSWVCSKNGKGKDMESYAISYDLAKQIYTNMDSIKDVTYGSKFYHAKYVKPRWKYKRVITIGDHVFYRG